MEVVAADYFKNFITRRSQAFVTCPEWFPKLLLRRHKVFQPLSTAVFSASGGSPQPPVVFQRDNKHHSPLYTSKPINSCESFLKISSNMSFQFSVMNIHYSGNNNMSFLIKTPLLIFQFQHFVFYSVKITVRIVNNVHYQYHQTK